MLLIDARQRMPLFYPCLDKYHERDYRHNKRFSQADAITLKRSYRRGADDFLAACIYFDYTQPRLQIQ